MSVFYKPSAEKLGDRPPQVSALTGLTAPRQARVNVGFPDRYQPSMVGFRRLAVEAMAEPLENVNID